MSAERAAEVLAEHYGAGADLTTPRQYTARGGWNISCTCGVGIGETGDDDIEQRHNAHVAAALSAAGCLRDDREGETVTEWGVRWIDVTGTAFEAGYIRMRGPNERPYATAEDARRDSSPVTHVVSRQRTTFPDVVTDWTPVTDGGDTDD